MGFCRHDHAAFSEMACFQVVYDGHQPEYPGDFTSVEQTVDEVISYLKSHASPVWVGPMAAPWAVPV